jgi:hypothetical protein
VGLDPSVFSMDDRRDPEGNLLKPPFPGLESFADTDADAAIFYGRSSEIAQVLEELREFRASGDRRAYAHAGRAYVIQGASGSGKSSLLKAGVLPRLRRERGWVALRSFRPGADPLLHFAEALAKPLEGRNTNQAPGAIRDRLLDNWRSAKSGALHASTRLDKSLPGEARGIALSEIDSQMLRTLRRQLDAEINPLKLQLDRPAATTLIAIDQGEELVRAEGDSADALADYVRAALLRTSEDQPAHYAVVLTVRTDSFQEVQTSPRLEGLATRLLDLRALPIYRFPEAIEQPAARYGVEIEPQLVEMLMDDAGGRDALPLLAFTLQRLWRQYEAERRIRRAHYESVGKLLGLIEDAAERALRGVDPSAQQGPLTGRVSNARDGSAQRVFVPALAQVNERGGTIRRVANLSGFDDDGREILTSFEKWRLVVTSGATVEVAHEALFRAWPRFLRWLEPEKARLETLRGLESAAASWDSNGRRDDFISHAGRRLRDALALMDVTDFRNYIDRNSAVRAYLKAAGRAARGWRIATWYTLTSFCIATLGIAIVLIWFYVSGYHKAIPLLLIFSIPIVFVIGPLTAFFAYLAAYLRQSALHSGFHSDVIVLLLVILSSAWFFSDGDQGLAGKAENLRRTLERQGDAIKPIYEGLDDRTMGIIATVQEYSMSPIVPVVFWCGFELLWIITIPFSIFARKFIWPLLPKSLQNRYKLFGFSQRLPSQN